MADKKDSSKKVKVYAPDQSLWNKIGRANLDKIMTPQIIESAQNTINQSSENFYDESLVHMQDVEQLWENLRQSPEKAPGLLSAIAHATFSLKSKAGIGGYDLIGDLAKSLQLHCEELEGKPWGEKNLEIIDWHITSMKQLLTAGTKGAGGETGIAISNELKRLN